MEQSANKRSGRTIPSKEELIQKILGLKVLSESKRLKAVSNTLQSYFKLRDKKHLMWVNVNRKELFDRCYDMADLRLLVQLPDNVPDNDILHLLAGEFDQVSCFYSFIHYGLRCGKSDHFIAYMGVNHLDCLCWLNKNFDSTLLMAAVHTGKLSAFLPLYMDNNRGKHRKSKALSKVDILRLFLTIYDTWKTDGCHCSELEGIEGLDRFVDLCRSNDYSWLKRHPFISSFGKKGCMEELESSYKELESIRAAIPAFDYSTIDDFDYVKAYLKGDSDHKAAFCSHFGLDGAAHFNKLKELYPNEVLLRYARLGELNTLPLDVDRDNRYVYEEAAKGCFHLINTADCFFYVVEHLEADPVAFMRHFGFQKKISFESIKDQVLANKTDSDFVELIDCGLLYKILPEKLGEYGHVKAIRKNERLSKQLDNMRDTMCGIGTRRLKLLLNRLIKGGDQLAQAYRMALELEDVNIQAKRSYGQFQDKIYEKKHKLLIELMDLCRAQKYVFGHQCCKGRGVNVIIYFELPNADQISFHTYMPSIPTNIPLYKKEWNGIENHTLPALEAALLMAYPEAIAKVKEAIEKQAKKAG